MRTELPKVLMLGWEFPPIINGGLGVACHDLSGAMSEFTDITMVVPKSSKDYKVRKVNLLGMNNLDVNSLEPGPGDNKLPFELRSIPANLDPYYSHSQGEAHDTQGKSAGDAF